MRTVAEHETYFDCVLNFHARREMRWSEAEFVSERVMIRLWIAYGPWLKRKSRAQNVILLSCAASAPLLHTQFLPHLH